MKKLINWKLSIKGNLLLMLKLMYFSDSFGMTFISKSNSPRFYIISGNRDFFSLWNTTVTLLQSICADPLYFLVI